MRTNASALFKVMVSKFSSEFLKSAVSEILTLPLSGKTTGVDHRITLDTMLTMLPNHDAASVILVNSLPTLIIKETNDVAISLLVRTLPTHLNHLLACNTPIPADVTTLVSKEVNSAKSAMKRGFVSVVGAALWGLDAVSESINDATKGLCNLWRVGGMHQDGERESTRYDRVLWKGTSPWPSRSVTWLFLACSARLCLHFGCHGQSHIGQWNRS